MIQEDSIERVINVLKKVPPKNLKIIDLVNNTPIINGELDYDYLADKQPEIHLAIEEAKTYGSYTLHAVETLKRLLEVKDDVGP